MGGQLAPTIRQSTRGPHHGWSLGPWQGRQGLHGAAWGTIRGPYDGRGAVKWKVMSGFCPEGCPAAYTKLQVTDLPSLRQHFMSKRWIEASVHRFGDQCWLDTYQAVRGMRHSSTISGPAAQSGSNDFVPTLVCNEPHPSMFQEFLNRTRKWPPASLISILLKLPMLLVLIGCKPSPNFNMQARISWSHFGVDINTGASGKRSPRIHRL